MKFLIIIPTHNEEDHLFYCLESLRNQSFTNYKIVVVNDGSTDKTPSIIQEFEQKDHRFSFITLEKSNHAPGSKVVNAFNAGLKTQNLDDFEVVCKYDSDIIFPENYLEKVNDIYKKNPKAGMVSGLVKIKKNVLDYSSAFNFKDEKHQWQFENISSTNHVRGPIKSYRKECFKDINGLRPTLGWDNIDVMLAKMHHWEVITIKNSWVKHLRPTAYKYKKQKAEKLGEYFYNIGLNLPLAAISSAKSSFKNKSFFEFFTTMKTFLQQKGNRQISEEEIQFIRNLRWNEMLKKK